MSSLTKFIDFNLRLPTVSKSLSQSEMNEQANGSCYEIIENENITNCNLSNLSISGSLFSLTTFKNVSFESCVFFASRLENCNFIDCTFKNCSFQFSHIDCCTFKGCHFENNKWELSPVNKSYFSESQIDTKTQFFIEKESNQLSECQFENNKSWEDVLQLPPIPTEEEIELEENRSSLLLQYFKQLAA